MERLMFDSAEVYKYYERKIDRQIPVEELAAKVFSFDETKKFTMGIREIAEVNSSKLKIGGRLLREYLGITTSDLAGGVSKDYRFLELLQEARIGKHVIETLKKFKDQKMSRPDLDSFVDGIDVELIAELLDEKGLQVIIRKGSGEVKIAEVIGEKGVATFIESEKSWQTKPSWPAIGFQSEVRLINGDPYVDITQRESRIYAYPLQLVFGSDNPVYPPGFAGISRALLWSITIRDPRGHLLKLPSRTTKDEMLRSIACAVPLMRYLEDHPEESDKWGHSLVDLALSLRLIELNTPDSYLPDYLATEEIQEACSNPFYKEVESAFWSGKGNNVKIVNDELQGTVLVRMSK